MDSLLLRVGSIPIFGKSFAREPNIMALVLRRMITPIILTSISNSFGRTLLSAGNTTRVLPYFWCGHREKQTTRTSVNLIRVMISQISSKPKETRFFWSNWTTGSVCNQFLLLIICQTFVSCIFTVVNYSSYKNRPLQLKPLKFLARWPRFFPKLSGKIKQPFCILKTLSFWIWMTPSFLYHHRSTWRWKELFHLNFPLKLLH